VSVELIKARPSSPTTRLVADISPVLGFIFHNPLSLPKIGKHRLHSAKAFVHSEDVPRIMRARARKPMLLRFGLTTPISRVKNWPRKPENLFSLWDYTSWRSNCGPLSIALPLGQWELPLGQWGSQSFSVRVLFLGPVLWPRATLFKENPIYQTSYDQKFGKPELRQMRHEQNGREKLFWPFLENCKGSTKTQEITNRTR